MWSCSPFAGRELLANPPMSSTLSSLLLLLLQWTKGRAVREALCVHGLIFWQARMLECQKLSGSSVTADAQQPVSWNAHTWVYAGLCLLHHSAALALLQPHLSHFNHCSLQLSLLRPPKMLAMTSQAPSPGRPCFSASSSSSSSS